jgi:hypothetical protein
MEITQGHQTYADKCVTLALSSEDDVDKALWLTLAQSWVQLGEQVAHVKGELIYAGSDPLLPASL